ncbi:hypothetical protein FIBSPDRAFT_896731 [Athelia psychrophila]|uniref:Uncharacterized protein n=1 Tax=Athelia psychrophila TaxID=1759441 RepID=A0A166D1Z8_9AGAM|nr:hypothetical protein FIBSPDRAFT_896731 [Fibularhizoctonia sp. CBS 109695]
MIFVFGSLLCISLATDAVCASSACSMNETLPILSVPVTMTSRDNDNDSRSLLAIVYSHPAAVFACVWVAAHPNIHHVPDRTQGYIRRKLGSTGSLFWSMFTTLTGLVVLEVLLLISSRQ